MFISVKNLGKIETAGIEIDAITVIAGENNSGKSTVGKALFCIFNSFYDINRQINDERLSIIESRLPRRFELRELAESIVENKDKYINDKSLLQQDLTNQLVQNDPDSVDSEEFDLDEIANKIVNYLEVSDDKISAVVLRKKMQAEFNMQINNLHHPEKESEIVLKIKETDVMVRIGNNENIVVENQINLNTEVIYFDDPHAMDNLRNARFPYMNQNYPTHREHLRSCLKKGKASSLVKEALDEIVATKKLGKVYEKLNSVCPGEMVSKTRRPYINRESFAYRENDTDVLIDITNVSTGLKAFIVVKTLLLNGCLEEKGTIVLDEPEKHLHPEWQLVFAELIVLIQKEFNMHILINTHSPYFLDAIDVYSRNHGIAGRCKYYLAENSGTTSKIRDVSNNIEKIYQKLAKPLQDLENARYADD